MKIPERERRDLLLLGAIVLLGVLLMFISGQFAIRMLPRWNVPSDMQSNIDPNLRLDSGSDALASFGLAPLRPEIQTPPAWQRTFLTPQANLDLLNEVPVVVVAPVTSQPTWTATQAAAPTETQNPNRYRDPVPDPDSLSDQYDGVCLPDLDVYPETARTNIYTYFYPDSHPDSQPDFHADLPYQPIPPSQR
jgi:hypothetical protein